MRVRVCMMLVAVIVLFMVMLVIFVGMTMLVAVIVFFIVMSSVVVAMLVIFVGMSPVIVVMLVIFVVIPGIFVGVTRHVFLMTVHRISLQVIMTSTVLRSIQDHLKAACLDAAFYPAADLDAVSVHIETFKTCQQFFPAGSQIQECRHHHISADAGVTFQIKHVFYLNFFRLNLPVLNFLA